MSSVYLLMQAWPAVVTEGDKIHEHVVDVFASPVVVRETYPDLDWREMVLEDGTLRIAAEDGDVAYVVEERHVVERAEDAT